MQPEDTSKLEALLSERMQQQMDAVADVVVAARREGRAVMAQAACMGHADLLAAVLSRDSSSPDPAAQQERSAALLCAAEKGREPCVRVQTDACPDLVHARDDKGRTALFFAAAGGHDGCLRVLLRHDAEAQVAPATTAAAPLPTPHLALKSLKALLPLLGSTALMAACAGGRAACARTLLEVQPDMQVAYATASGSNALMMATVRGSVACIEALLQHSPNTQTAQVDNGGINALTYACVRSDRAAAAACVQLLLRHDPDVQLAVASDGYSALRCAAAVGNSECMQLLLQHSLQPQRPDQALRTAASLWAKASAAMPRGQRETGRCAQGFRLCVELLLAVGARLPPDAPAKEWGVVQSVIQDCAARSLVPFMTGHVVAGLRALATARERKVEADAAGPSGASCEQAGTTAEPDHGAQDAHNAGR